MICRNNQRLDRARWTRDGVGGVIGSMRELAEVSEIEEFASALMFIGMVHSSILNR